MILYLDTTVVARVLFREPGRLPAWGRWEHAYSSEIMGLEARRAIDRRRLDGALDDDQVAAAHRDLLGIERSLALIDLTRGILDRASLPMATSVKTLDAIHLASAMVFRERRQAIVFATHDRQQAVAAQALGFEVAV